MRIQTTFSRKLVLMSLLAVFCGCADVHSSVKGDAMVEQAKGGVLREIKVAETGEGARVVLSADRPLAYTFYKTADPPKAVIDLARTEPGAIASPMDVNSDTIRRIETVRYGEGATAMTRVEVYFTRDTEANATIDASDKGMLVLAVARPVAPAASVAVEAAPAAGQAGEGSTSAPVAVAAAPAVAPTPVVVEPQALIAPVVAPQTGPPVIKAIEAQNGYLVIETRGEIKDFKFFRLAKPDRLVVDISDAKLGINSKAIPLNALGVGMARIGAYPDKVRIVLDAAGGTLSPLNITKGAAGLIVAPADKVVEAPRAAAPAQPSASASQARQPEAVKSAEPAKGSTPAVEAIEFKVLDGTSRITVAVTGACANDKPVKSADGFSVTLRNCILPKKLQRHLDTGAFASVVQKVTPYQVKTKGRSDVKIQVLLRQSASYDVMRDGDLLQMSIRNPEGFEPPVAQVPASPALQDGMAQAAVRQKEPSRETDPLAGVAQSGGTKKVYTGRRVTLEFSDADIRKIFQLIAEVSNLNFLVGDDVTGTISLKLVNVPWDQALDVILENKGLGMQRDGNIVQIRPKSKIQTLADEEQALKRAKERGMELKTEVFDINFAAVGDIVSQFNAVKSERGTISQDARTNRVIVKDIEPALAEMRILLKNLDLPEKQVLIEARIVEATSTFTRDLGVQWGIHSNDSGADIIRSVDAGFGGIVTPPPASGFPAATSSGGAVGISFAKMGSLQVDLRLSAAAVAGLVKIVSTPKVVTLNNKAAKISQGQSIPYQTTSAEGTKTEFVEAALTLEVTPHITADGSVSMKIKASNNSAGTGSPPPINKKEATTELLVKNGETTVIGGIYVDSDTDEDRGVPFLMDIPVLGWLFKSNTKNKTKTELLIFITPKIVS
ncbi:type IV pilus secretin PilQ [Geobacter sulfurreducens]|uniref:type IV pilus secretin PilQ n=1 Tax=Geobacter sulfurreducens TaxID=35554 RepID=UPI000DBB51CB|nr:type IV pilus secretin PilQ [Geobacter sulfurreducens]BBA70523.1 Type IV pilus biogenesis and competence protein PilQ [Geobacter sulfurreducens]